LVAFLGESPWNSTDKPLLLVDPNCVSIEQLPGSDIQMGVCLPEGGGQTGKAAVPALCYTPAGDLPHHATRAPTKKNLSWPPWNSLIAQMLLHVHSKIEHANQLGTC